MEELTQKTLVAPALTVEDIIARYDNLVHYDENLEVASEEMMYHSFNSQELLIAAAEETIFVYTLRTIARYYNWMENNKHRPFYQKKYYDKITDPSAKRGPFGEVLGEDSRPWGQHIPAQDFPIWKEAYDLIFEYTDDRTEATVIQEKDNTNS